MYLLSHGSTQHGRRTAKHRHIYSEPDLTRTPLRARPQIIIRIPNPVEAMSSGVFGCARPAPKPHRAAAAAAALSVLLWLPTRTANRHVMQQCFNRLAHRLDASEAALEEERHAQVVVQRAAPACVPRAAAAAPQQRGAAAGLAVDRGGRSLVARRLRRMCLLYPTPDLAHFKAQPRMVATTEST